MGPKPTSEQLEGCTPDQLRAEVERRWFDRLDQALRDYDESGRVLRDRRYAEPFRTLFRQVVEVISTSERFMLMPEEGRVSYRPNPWHADPAEPTLIGRGMRTSAIASGRPPVPAPRPCPWEIRWPRASLSQIGGREATESPFRRPDVLTPLKLPGRANLMP